MASLKLTERSQEALLDEVLLDVGGGLLTAMRAGELLRPINEILNVQLEGALALLASQIDGHVRMLTSTQIDAIHPPCTARWNPPCRPPIDRVQVEKPRSPSGASPVFA